MSGDTVVAGVVVGLILLVIPALLSMFLPAIASRSFVAWVRVASWASPVKERSRRIDESRSFVWEHFHDPDVPGRTATVLALLLLVRLLWTIPGDAASLLRGLLRQARVASGRFQIVKVNADGTTIIVNADMEGAGVSSDTRQVRSTLSQMVPPNEWHQQRAADNPDVDATPVDTMRWAMVVGEQGRNRAERRQHKKERSTRKKRGR